jgi:hypothetical protein
MLCFHGAWWFSRTSDPVLGTQHVLSNGEVAQWVSA